MPPTVVTMAITDIVVGVLFILLCLPLLKRRIPMNGLYGFRFRQSFTSEENWYRINEYGAQRMILWSLGIVFFGLMLFMPAFYKNPGILVLCSLAPLLVIIPVIESYQFARQLGRLDGE